MLRSLVVFFILLAGVADSFAGDSCASLFRDPLVWAEQTNKDNNQYLTQDSLAYKISQIPAGKQKSLNKLFKRVQEGDVISEKDLSGLSEDIVILLYGPRDIADRYFLKSKSERADESLRFQVRKQLLEKGFQSFLQGVSPKEKIHLWLKLKQSVRRVLQSTAFNLLQIFWGVLPDRRSVPIPEDLMTRVIWEGVDAHSKEVNSYVHTQSKVELYGIVKRISSYVLVGALTVHGFQQGVQHQRAERDAKVDLAVQQLDYFSSTLASDVQASKLEVRQQALADAVATFKSEIGRSPTEDEVATMKKMIFEVPSSVRPAESVK